MSRQEEFVLRTVEDREVRFIRLWFTDVLGGLKSVAIVPAELEGAFSEGIGFDGSAVEGLSRVYEADMVLKPDPSTFSLLAVARRDRADGPDVLRHPRPRGRTGQGRPAQRPQAHPRSGGKEGLHLLCPPGDRVLPLPLRQPRFRQRDPRCARARRHRRLLRPRQRRHRERLPPLGGDDARGDGSVRRVLPPRGGTRPERDRPPLRRRADDGRQHHDVPVGDQGGRDRPGRLRLLHAQAALRPSRQRDAHPSPSSRGRTTRSSNRGRPTSCRRPGASSSRASSITRRRSPR